MHYSNGVLIYKLLFFGLALAAVFYDLDQFLVSNNPMFGWKNPVSISGTQ